MTECKAWHAIREHDETGRLIAAGYCWNEDSSWLGRGHLWGTLGALLYAAFCFILAAGFRTDYINYVGATSVVIAIVTACTGPMLWPWKRALIFTAEGKMQLPFGMMGHRYRASIPGHHSAVVSVESAPDRGRFGVIMISSDGDRGLIANRLSNQEAFKVAVQLSHALNDLRRGQASSPSQIANPRGGDRPAPSAVMID